MTSGISRKGNVPIRRIKLSEVGRGKNTEVVEVSTRATPDDIAQRLADEASKYLLSSGVGCIWNDETGTGTITVGGFRAVGKAEEIKL